MFSVPKQLHSRRYCLQKDMLNTEQLCKGEPCAIENYTSARSNNRRSMAGHHSGAKNICFEENLYAILLHFR